MRRPGGTYRLPENLAQDLERLHAMVEQVRSGQLDRARFRAFRVPMGIYEQRENDTYMLRVRFPAGAVLPHQMRVLADVATRFGNGILHATTRQDIQVHRVPLDGIHPAQVALLQAGLSTKGGGGNSVRNIIACPLAGVCPCEVFGVAPHALALTEFLLPDPLSYRLPRKYKIALSGCGRDCAGATINDLGLIAREKDGRRGFAAWVGGGLGAKSRVAKPLREFVPEGEIHILAEAIKRLFDKHGNRRNKHHARLRFLLEDIGLEHFKKLLEPELQALRRDPPPFAIGQEWQPPPEPTASADSAPAEGFETWRATNAGAQKQPGYHFVHIPLFLGDISAEKMRALADVVEAHGERMLRTTQHQNLLFRWVQESELAPVHGALVELGLAEPMPPVIRNLVACAGASTCRLGICLSRGLARATRNALSREELDLSRTGDLLIHISGCPNSCGRHPIGHIGLFGAARRVGGRLVPHYVVQLGGRVAEGRTRLGEGRTSIPAREVPAFIGELLRAWRASAHADDFHAFLDSGGRALAERLLAEHREVPAFEEDKNYYFDWDGETLFSLAGRGPGECSAGVFDLIEVDLATAREALEATELYAATLNAARALLVTRGEEPGDESQTFELFARHFVAEGLVGEPAARAAAAGRQAAASARPAGAFEGSREDVAALVESVATLYANMDDSLRFRPARATDEPAPAEAAAEPDVTKDFRGVACPLNYVKTKLALEAMRPGQVLAVLLGDEGARNVPASAQNDGHEVLAVQKQDDHWRVVMRKGTA